MFHYPIIILVVRTAIKRFTSVHNEKGYFKNLLHSSYEYVQNIYFSVPFEHDDDNTINL